MSVFLNRRTDLWRKGKILSLYVGVLPFMTGMYPPIVRAQHTKHALTGENKMRLGETVRISPAEDKGDALPPMWLYADPSDGQHLIYCSRVGYPDAMKGQVYASADAGKTWKQTLLHGPADMKWVSEEACTVGNDGKVYYA